MYLKVKILCICGCSYEVDTPYGENASPKCPNCGVRLDAASSKSIDGILALSGSIPDDVGKRIKFSLKSRSQNS